MCVLIWLAASAAAGAQDTTPCTAIDDDAARLRCYDEISGFSRRTPARDESAPPALSFRWERHLMAQAEREPFRINAYQPNYVLVTHLQSFNYEPYRPYDPEDRLSENEIKFNLSVETKILDDLFGDTGDLWVSYTQTSYWQVLNSDISSPFRATDYNPEARLAFLTDLRLPGVSMRAVNIGLRHDSNGQAGSLSRSWNRVFADFQFARGSLLVGVRPWVRVFNSSDNPDIEDYYGHVDVRASWERRNQLFSAMLRNPFDSRFGAELSWSFPISGRLRGIVQWYYGYGENLIDYDHKNNRIGVGLLLSDWL
jgi:phospholipase A1